MKISIIGSNGFLSTAIGKYANASGWRVDCYGLDAPTGHQFDNFYKINLMTGAIDCEKLLASDMVVYASGAGIQSNLKEGADLVYGLNVSAPIMICNKLKELNFQGVFVTFGSVFEVGETVAKSPFSEDVVLNSTCRAPSEYVVSKRVFSRFVSSYEHEFTHWHFVIPTIYGEGENPKRLIPYVVNAIRLNGELHFTSGDQVRQYIYVGEVPVLLEMALKKDLKSGVYNIEGSETLTVREIVQKVFDSFDRRIPKDCFGSAERSDVGMKYLALDGTKLRNTIGFTASTKIADVIARY